MADAGPSPVISEEEAEVTVDDDSPPPLVVSPALEVDVDEDEDGKVDEVDDEEMEVESDVDMDLEESGGDEDGEDNFDLWPEEDEGEDDDDEEKLDFGTYEDMAPRKDKRGVKIGHFDTRLIPEDGHHDPSQYQIDNKLDLKAYADMARDARNSVDVGHYYDTSRYRLSLGSHPGEGGPFRFREYPGEGGEWGESQSRIQLNVKTSSEGSSEWESSEDSEEAFQRDVMQIPEEPARERLDEFARNQERQRDEILKYFPEPDEYPDGIPPTDKNYQSKAEPRIERCPSIESFFRIKRTIDVRFYLYPGGRMISKECRLDATVVQLKQAIAHFVQVPYDHLDLRRRRNLVADNRTLAELGAGPKSKMKFTVEINKRIHGDYQIRLPKDKVTYEKKSKVITVNLGGNKGKVQVTIDFATEPHQKIGGYLDTRTGVKLLHAWTMTESLDAEAWESSDSHKATQSFFEVTQGTQTRINFGQQMEREDYYICKANDRYIRARDYVTADEFLAKRTQAIITIQRYWRGWLGRWERKKRMEGLIRRIQWAENIRKGRIEQRYAIMDDEIRRQECPSKMVDIELLYRAINLWRKEQEDYVKRNRWGPERKAALAILTEMEADLLLDLERTRKRIQKKGIDANIETQFNKMGKPKRWLGAKTDVFITMDTKERLHVRHLHQTYKKLKTMVNVDSNDSSDNGISLQERLELLGRVNDMAKGVLSTKLGQMLSDLITRELTYIRIKASPTLMASLRKRIANTFFLLCQDPLFNPEAKQLQKVPFDYTKLRKDMVQCKGCRRMQYRDEFTIQRGTIVTSRCRSCMGLYRTAILRVDLNLYRHMLEELRQDELAAGVTNSVTFLIDAFDMQFLVEQIWHGQSALSGIDNRYLFRLCRWVKNEPWTPWNCVLLTEEEAISHLQLDNLKDAYTDTFFHKVFVKQCTAKTYFEGLGKLAVGLDDSISEGCKKYWDKQKRLKESRMRFRHKARLLRIMAGLR